MRQAFATVFRWLFSLATLLLSARAFAATHVWTGPASGGLWSTSGNWMGGTPSSGEPGGTIVEFGSGITCSDDIMSLVVDQIHFTGSNTTLSGSKTLGVTGSVLSDNILADGGSGNFIGSTLPLSLSGVAPVARVGAGFQLEIQSTVGGSVGLVKQGPGTLIVSGTTNNSYLSPTAVNEGILGLHKTGAHVAISGDVVVGDGAGGANADVLRLLAFNEISSSSAMTINASGLFDVNGFGNTIASLAGSGNVALGAGTLTVGGSSATTYAGVIDGTGNLTKTGAGALTLTGTNGFSGIATVSAGTLSISGGAVPAQVAVTGGTLNLGSAAVIGPLSATGGTVAPGGITADGTASSGGASFNAATTYKATLNGTTGTTFTKLSVTGAANLGNATLTVAFGFSPVANDTFSILETTGGITGTFANLPDGGTLMAGSGYMVVHYVPMGTPTGVTLTFFPCAGETVVPTVTAPAATTLTQSVCQ